MTPAQKARVSHLADELASLYKLQGSLNPAAVVEWAKDNDESELHSRFDWDDTSAAGKYRLWQARDIIASVTIEHAPGKSHKVYVSPVEMRGDGGYVSMVDVMNDDELRARFLAQALAEYERIGLRYEHIRELAKVRAAVKKVAERTVEKTGRPTGEKVKPAKVSAVAGGGVHSF